MKFILEVSNTSERKISKKSFLDIFKATLELAKIDCLEKKELELSVALVDEDEIKTLNTRYRQKNSATDVLSFCEFESTVELCEKNPATGDDRVFLGELIVCPAYIEKNATEDGETFEYAFDYIISHGILHLLGYGHGKKMFAMQREVANQLLNRKK